MAERHPTPGATPLRGLRLLRGDTIAPDTDTDPGVAPDTAGRHQGGDTDTHAVAVPGAEVVPLSAGEHASVTLRHWATAAAEGAGRLWLNPGRVLHVLWHGKPESMAEHHAYIKSRAWVPQEMTGKPAAVIVWAGVMYHLLIACPVKTAARTIDAAAERPLRMLMLTVFLSALVLILLHL